MNWSDWHRFSEDDGWYRISQEGKPTAPYNCKTGGVYQIRATSHDCKPLAIQRAFGPDPDGILYIGCGNLCGRIGFLLNIYKDDAKHHHDFTEHFVDYGLAKFFDRKYLEVRWAECDDHIQEEKRLLHSYKKRTGDIPPGNLKFEGKGPLQFPE